MTVCQESAAAVADGLIPVIGYIRVSTWREEKISPQIQSAAIQDQAARKGRRVVAWVEDLDATGRNFKRRIMDAIEGVEARTAREIWVWKFSRFGRSRHGVAINLARVEAAGGHLVSATEDVDATTATGRFARGMLFELAAFESDRAGEQWQETHALRRAAGVPATGKRRFGYTWHPRRVPDGKGGWLLQPEWYEVEALPAEAIVEAYQSYNTGRIGFMKLADRWRELGHVTVRGTRWQAETVKWYMDTGFAAGLLMVHDQGLGCPPKCHKLPHYRHQAAEHEAIITGDEWEAYQGVRRVRRTTPARSNSPTYPLSGLVRCGICKGAARATHQRGTRCYAYSCAKRGDRAVDHEPIWRRRTLIEDAVFEWLQTVRREIDRHAAGVVVEGAQSAQATQPTVDRSAVRDELVRIASALDRATMGHVSGVIPLDTYMRTRDQLQAQQQSAQKKLANLGAPEAAPKTPVDHRETIAGLIEDWRTIDVASKRVLLAKLIRRVEIMADGVRVVPSWAPDDADAVRRIQESFRAPVSVNA